MNELMAQYLSAKNIGFHHKPFLSLAQSKGNPNVTSKLSPLSTFPHF